MKESSQHVKALRISLVLLVTLFVSALLVFVPPLAPAAEKSNTIVDEWLSVKAPPPPELKKVTVDPKTTALLILDIQSPTCTTRPRCVASVPKIQVLLAKAREKGVPVIYSLSRAGKPEDIRQEVSPLTGEPIVQSSVDKFFKTDLENILKEKKITTVIVTGTVAEGAVMFTATGAALRGLKVIIPVDGMSSDDTYREQYTAWHMINAPGSQRQTTLTSIDMISFRE
jgi:nicotinamidase-related amidase